MPEKLKELFNESIAIFFNTEAKNIAGGTSERNLCCRLAMTIENKMKENGIQGYYADTEYNRMTYDKIKKVWIGGSPTTVVCDLVVHSRGEVPDKDNLIAIEMKKSSSSHHKKIEQDKSRLRSMTECTECRTSPGHVCGYQIGFFIEIDPQQHAYKIEEFRGGISVNTCTGTF